MAGVTLGFLKNNEGVTHLLCRCLDKGVWHRLHLSKYTYSMGVTIDAVRSPCPICGNWETEWYPDYRHVTIPLANALP